MPEVDIKGIPVQFPFEPYDVQRAYMEKVIDCLQTGANAMLESPTGTGKTLSLLCSTLAWLTIKKAQMQAQRIQSSDLDYADKLMENLNNATGLGPANQPQSWGMMTPKIIYSSRTHSQLTQAVAELKRTSYTHMRAAVLGSRDQLCTHPEVSKEENTTMKMSMCQMLVKARSCHLQRNIERKRDDMAFTEAGIMDIEDLVKVCDKLRVCPYYMSRELKQTADIVFMPYQYLLDPRTRKQQDVDLQNSIVILDEGHNVEKMCEESASYQITSTDIAMCIREVTDVMKVFADMPSSMNDFNADDEGSKDFTVEELMMMKTVLLELEKAVDMIPLTDKGHTESSFPGEYIFTILEKATITVNSSTSLRGMLDKIVQYITTAVQSGFQRSGVGLSKLSNFLNIVFNLERRTMEQHVEAVKACYKVFVTVEKPKFPNKRDTWLSGGDSESKPGGKVVNFWCFHPGFGMRTLLDQGVHSIIVTSGTLSPLGPLISELGIPINVTLENGHVISKDQVFVSVVRQGPDGTTLNSSFKNRDSAEYLSSLGKTVRNFARMIPEGLLVFFPSYPVMNKTKDHWQQTGIWSEICALKEIFVEPQNKRDFKEVMTGYYAKIVQPGSKGACFLAVCRGKVSEGLDFADYNGRAVILTGLPYPPFYDPRVIMKKEYLDRNKKKVTGSNWYTLEATRAVNQAVGRVIRHKNDYGAVLFCDERFSERIHVQHMSAWLRPYVSAPPNFGLVTRGVCQFFKKAKETLPQPKGKVMSDTWGDRSDDPPISQAVSASFDTSARWISTNKSSQSSSFNWNPQQASPLNSSVSSYSQRSKLSSQATSKPTSMFDALEQSQKVESNIIILDGPDPPQCEDEDGDVTVIDEDEQVVRPPDPKKRKIRVMGVPLSYDSSVTSDDATEGATACCSSVPQSSSSALATPLEDKKAQMIQYLKQVKTSLTKVEMKTFNDAVRSYSKESNYSQLIRTLEELFNKPELYFCIKGFDTYIKNAHKEEFAMYCKRRFS